MLKQIIILFKWRPGLIMKKGDKFMNIVRWDPFREMVSFKQAADRLFDNGFIRPHLVPADTFRGLTPAVDMYETDGELVVKATIPGVDEDGLHIDIMGDMLTIKGETKQEHETKEVNYYHRERRQGVFTRALSLPTGLKADKAKAELENGILTLTIPKAESIKPKVIKVKAKQVAEGKKEEKD
jgi:HSP20 family protein